MWLIGLKNPLLLNHKDDADLPFPLSLLLTTVDKGTIVSPPLPIML